MKLTIFILQIFKINRLAEWIEPGLFCPLSLSRLQEEVQRGKAAAADLRAQAEDAGRKASQLERQLAVRGAECRELEELRSLTRNQEQRVTQSLREAQQNQAELAGLEAILALLHLREVNTFTLTLFCVFCEELYFTLIVFGLKAMLHLYFSVLYKAGPAHEVSQ